VLPKLAVAIDHQRGLWIRLNVDQSLKLRRARSLRLFINRRVEILSIKNKADRYDVRLTVTASGSEMGNPRGMNKPQRGRGRVRDSSHLAMDTKQKERRREAQVRHWRGVRELLPNASSPIAYSFLKVLIAGRSKGSKARRAKSDELRRTRQYVEASRASATKLMRAFQQPVRS
jgi:hypothetical protein